ncbi:hypothetical protein ACFLT9_01240 [Acidobacteriota bacterium]
MKKRAALILVLGLCLCFSLSAQKPADLVGTWVGTATLEGEAETNDLTLVLELKDGVLAGHMSDQFGSMVETPIEEVKLEKDVFTFSMSIDAGGMTMSITFEMKVEGSTMKGTLEVPDMGASGTWEATKQ